MSESAISILDKHIRYCEDMALDLNDIGGRNAEEKAAKFSETARDLMDVKAEIKRLSFASADLYEALSEQMAHWEGVLSPEAIECSPMLRKARAALLRAQASDKSGG